MYSDSNPKADREVSESDKPKNDKATFLIPKNVFGDKTLEPGTRCEIEVTRVLDDQVEAIKVADSEYRDEGEEMEVEEVDEVDELMT